MNADDLQRFTVILSAKREELIKRGRNREALAVEKLADPLDRGVQAASRECAAIDQERAYNLLQETVRALQRIDNGDFGLCLHCEEEINPKRLNAVPWAAHCVICQELLDSLKPSGPQCARTETSEHETYGSYIVRREQQQYSFA